MLVRRIAPELGSARVAPDGGSTGDTFDRTATFPTRSLAQGKLQGGQVANTPSIAVIQTLVQKTANVNSSQMCMSAYRREAHATARLYHHPST